MKRRGIAFLLLWLLLIPNGAGAQETQETPPKDVAGWRTATWGMTREQVMKEFAADGIKEVDGKLEITPFRLLVSDFDVTFGFLDPDGKINYGPGAPQDELAAVTLTGSDDAAEKFPRLIFQGLESQLVAKYGQPGYRTNPQEATSRIGPTSGDSSFVQANWTFPTTTISLTYADNSAGMGLNIVILGYTKNKPADLDKF